MSYTLKKKDQQENECQWPKALSHMSNLIDCGSTCDVSLSYISLAPDQIHLPPIHRQPRMAWQSCNLCCQKFFQMPPENKLRVNFINK